MKFKVGQIVELIKNPFMNAGIGSRAKVVKAEYEGAGSLLIGVEWVWFINKGCSQVNGGYYLDYFKPCDPQLLFNFMYQRRVEKVNDTV